MARLYHIIILYLIGEMLIKLNDRLNALVEMVEAVIFVRGVGIEV